ncbi:hypothetical protein Tco_0876688 [Tanacetum coccineum]|uniref:Reverse transcriptase domain-containing protein n=1 Tax=Tanacetum coccineum TaxID=301880 RepID=A0ABQ5BW13_9ASTR
MTPPTTHIDTALTPASPDYTPASPDYSPASDTESDPSKDPPSDHIPPLPAISPFLSSTDDSSDTSSALHRRVMILAPWQPIPHDDCEEEGWTVTYPYLVVRHSVDYSSSDHFALDDSLRDSSSKFPSARADLLPSPKRIRSPESATNLVVSLTESFNPSTSRGTEVEIDVDVERSDGLDIDPKIQAEIDECVAYADALRAKGIDARVVVEAVDREEIKTGAKGPVKVRVDRVTHSVIADDIPKPAQKEGAIEVTYETLGDLVQRFHNHTKEIPVHRVQAIESVQRDQGHRIVATGQQGADMLERIRELEQDNMRLRDMMDVASQRVTRSQRRKLGNVIATEPTKLQDAIRISNNLMDQKLKGYARSAENKRRLENNPRDNRGQQPVFKRQNVGGQNVARAYTAWNNEKKVVVTPNAQRAPVGNHPSIVFYKCGRPGHFRKDYPKLRNQNRGNQTRNKNGNKTGNQTGGNEATTRAYAIGGGGANPDSNVVTGTFLLNNCYASMLFDLGADRSFVCQIYLMAMHDLAPSTLDTSLQNKLCRWKNYQEPCCPRMPYHVLIVCNEKVIRIPYGDELLIIRGNDWDSESKSKLNIISCTKTQKYIQKGCQVYLAQVTSKKTEDKSEEKQLEDVLIVLEFPKVFPEDLPGLPPAR